MKRKGFCYGSRTVRERGLAGNTLTHSVEVLQFVRWRVTLVNSGVRILSRGGAVVDLLLLGQVQAISIQNTFLFCKKRFYLSFLQ